MNNESELIKEVLRRKEDLDQKIMSNAFRGNVKFSGDKMYLDAKDKKNTTVDTYIFFDRVTILLNKIYTQVLDSIKSVKNENDYALAIVSFTSMMLTYERSEQYFNNGSEQYKSLVRNIRQNLKEVKKNLGEHFFAKLMNIVFFNTNKITDVTEELYGVGKLSDEDILYMIKNFIGKEEFVAYLEEYLAPILDNGNIMTKLEELNYVKPKEVSQYIGREHLIESLIGNEDETEHTKEHNYKNNSKKTKKKQPLHILKYLQATDIFEAFSRGYIDTKALQKFTKIEDLFMYSFNKKDIMTILESKIYNRDASELIWELYEKDFFNDEDIEQIYKLNYLDPGKIINKYYEERKRKIALELKDAPNITEEKLFNFFSPDIILKSEAHNKNQEVSKFFREDLRAIYERNNADLERSIIKQQKINDENDKCKSRLLQLYTNGLVRLSKFSNEDISEQELLNLYNKQSDSKIIIEGFNFGLISQETVLDIFNDEDVLCEKICEGLDINILKGYYETPELLKFYKSGKLSIKQLSKLSFLWDADKIEEQYVSDQLTYEDLFGNFVKYGIIDYETATKINDKYDIDEKLNKLRKYGIIGRIADSEFEETRTFKKDKSNGTSKKNKDILTENKIDQDLAGELFINLGATDPVEVKQGTFEGFVVIPLIDKKIAILEGEGRTSVLPLRFVLEHIEHKGSDDDLIGNAVYKMDFYKSEYVKSGYHSKRWGRNIIKRMQELSPSINAEQLIKENEDILKKIEQKYDEKARCQKR